MWGSSFADLAKQAAEFQEQAAKKAAELSEQAAQLTVRITNVLSLCISEGSKLVRKWQGSLS
jgi:hypothetical protein